MKTLIFALTFSLFSFNTFANSCNMMDMFKVGSDALHAVELINEKYQVATINGSEIELTNALSYAVEMSFYVNYKPAGDNEVFILSLDEAAELADTLNEVQVSNMASGEYPYSDLLSKCTPVADKSDQRPADLRRRSYIVKCGLIRSCK